MVRNHDRHRKSRVGEGYGGVGELMEPKFASLRWFMVALAAAVVSVISLMFMALGHEIDRIEQALHIEAKQ